MGRLFIDLKIFLNKAHIVRISIFRVRLSMMRQVSFISKRLKIYSITGLGWDQNKLIYLTSSIHLSLRHAYLFDISSLIIHQYITNNNLTNGRFVKFYSTY